MVPFFLLLFGLIVFGYSVFLFRKSGRDREGLKIYGMIAYSALAVAAVASGTIIAPHLDSFNVGHAFLIFLAWNVIAGLLLKPGFKPDGSERRKSHDGK